jgi:hypothetical protein
MLEVSGVTLLLVEMMQIVSGDDVDGLHVETEL